MTPPLPPFVLLISIVVFHNNMTLKPLYCWKFFEFFPLEIKKKYWMVTELCQPFSSIQWDWMLTERPLNGVWNPISVNIPWAFSGHSEMFQLTERRIFILWEQKLQTLRCTRRLLSLFDYARISINPYACVIYVISVTFQGFFRKRNDMKWHSINNGLLFDVKYEKF